MHNCDWNFKTNSYQNHLTAGNKLVLTEEIH